MPIDSLIFQKIVQRFAPYTIANLYYGHTHNDQKLLLTLMPNHQNQINQSPLLGSFNHLLHLVTITQHLDTMKLKMKVSTL